mmetsp:Transcript_59337/g.176247  ORF Transcript_59337/g.176247 Transcript_59337/m.176247 type:complete len:135 (-) Transcript_59337:906-1310(-)
MVSASTKAALTILAVAALSLNPPALSVSAFSAPSPPRGSSDASASCDRRAALLKTATFAALPFLASPLPAFAKEIDPALKGTKNDPKYQACLSQCIYDCTKPKGDEQKSRAECLPECKKTCATSKEQLMVGTPK